MGNEHMNKEMLTTKASVSQKPTPGALKTFVFQGAKPREERSCRTGNEHPNEASNKESERFSKARTQAH
ncbi:hypothetical protein [Aureibacillus halotolerans]|uniref:hypothetical protein n=1 Tax=Aureibacillus halotolerans TaxID=1508390 RepID=UPI0010609356|nr:hypothetical protein [Aureibacillus halotolerans]